MSQACNRHLRTFGEQQALPGALGCRAQDRHHFAVSAQQEGGQGKSMWLARSTYRLTATACATLTPSFVWQTWMMPPSTAPLHAMKHTPAELQAVQPAAHVATLSHHGPPAAPQRVQLAFTLIKNKRSTHLLNPSVHTSRPGCPSYVN
jgi:hypothetical protein